MTYRVVTEYRNIHTRLRWYDELTNLTLEQVNRCHARVGTIWAGVEILSAEHEPMQH
jgi:hypothetical protein